MKSQSTAH